MLPKRLMAFGGEDAGDAGEVVGDSDVFPVSGIEQGLNGWKAVVAEFEDDKAAGFEVPSRLQDEFGVKFVAFFATEESGVRLVIANFYGKGRSFAVADIRRVADDEIEKR